MLEYLKGSLKAILPNALIIEVGGLGYKVFFPTSQISELPALEKTLQLFLSEVIREEAYDLYGFLTLASRNLFNLLGTVSGIGPKTALALINHFPDPHALLETVRAKNSLLLSKVPGIGKKTAERLIIEIKDKTLEGLVPSKTLSQNRDLYEDGVSALLNLGYSLIKAKEAVHKAADELEKPFDLSALITKALKII